MSSATPTANARIGEVMPAYKHRLAMSDDTSVWRYLSLDAVIATIGKRQLRLTRVDKFKDRFEGSVPKAQIDSQLLLFSNASRLMIMRQLGKTPPPPDEDPWIRITRWRRARTRSAHASCWSCGDESELLWRLYCAHDGCQGVGVALRTTLARLEASVEAHDLYVSPITYRPYHEGPPFTDEMDALLHKRHGFTAERELRLLKFDEAHNKALAPKDASVSELPEHIYVDWVLSDVIEEIVISPYADESYEDWVRRAIGVKDPNLSDRVMLSVMHERRYPPGF
jgi:hypothetical protein